MNILDKIVANKREEVSKAKLKKSISQLEQSAYCKNAPISISSSLRNSASGVIAEFKRKSPSKGDINIDVDVEDVVKGYQEAGASAVSILTDMDFFGGCFDDVSNAREQISLPILRKDFMVDEYQFVEAKSIGADVVLLIASVLDYKELKTFCRTAHDVGLEVLLEVHDYDELAKSLDSTDEYDLIGVNNRNLKDFSVSIETSKNLVDEIPDQYIKVAESGLSEPETLSDLRSVGFSGFLIGENFMKQGDPGQACSDFIAEVLRNNG